MDENTGILPDYVVNARDQSNSANDLVGQLVAGSYTIKDRLEKVIKETLDYNKDIIELRASALSDYLASPAQARYQYNSPTLEDGSANPNFILNPFQANKAIATDIQTSEIPFFSLNALLGQRTKGDAQLLDSAVGGYQAQTAAAQAAAQAARQTYSDTLNEFQIGEDKRRWEAEFALKKAGSGSGASAKRYSAIQDAIQGADQVIATMKGQGMDVSSKTVDEVYSRVFDNLRAQGIDVTPQETQFISGEKANTNASYGAREATVDDFYPEGFETMEPSAQRSIRSGDDGGWLGRISDFLGIGSNPVANDINLPADMNVDLRRGMGNLDTFNDQFQYGGSATLR